MDPVRQSKSGTGRSLGLERQGAYGREAGRGGLLS